MIVCLNFTIGSYFLWKSHAVGETIGPYHTDWTIPYWCISSRQCVQFTFNKCMVGRVLEKAINVCKGALKHRIDNTFYTQIITVHIQSLSSITVSYISIGTIERVEYIWATTTRQHIDFNTILKSEYTLDQCFPL